MNRVKPWAELSHQHLLDCRIFSVESLASRSPEDESIHEFFRIRCVDWVHIVPVTSDDRVVLVRQFRHGSGELSLEAPAGLMEPGERPVEAAARECLEETGYVAGNLQPMGVLRPNPALFTNRMYSFYARDVRRVGEIQHTSTEYTEVELVPVSELPELLTSGRIDHALDTATLWRFLHEYKN